MAMNDLELTGQAIIKLNEVKANKSDIPKDQDLSGYAKKTDIYTKTETDTKLDSKANKSDLTGKADVGSSYTKLEADTKFSKDSLEAETRTKLTAIVG